MSKLYRWQEAPFINKIKSLEQMINQESLNKKQLDIIYDTIDVYHFLLEMAIKDNYKTESSCLFRTRISNVDLDSYVTKPNSYFNSIIEEIAELKTVDIDELKTLDYSEYYLIKKAKAFFKKLDSHLYKMYSSIEEKNKYLYHFTSKIEEDGLCLFDRVFNLPYIAINKSNTIVDMYTIVHEIGHALDFTFYNGYSQSYLLKEALSYFMEFLFSNYCIEQRYHVSQFYIPNAITYNDIIYASRFIISAQDDLKDQLLSDTCHHHLTDYQRNVGFVFSLLTATELLHHFQKDSQRTLNNIKTMPTNNNDTTPFNILKHLNIDPYSLGSNVKQKLRIHLNK